MKALFTGIFIMLLTVNGNSQYNILDSKKTQTAVEECLYATYGFDFAKAYSNERILNKALPQHPVSYFLKALIIYWENFPLLPDNPATSDFELNMDLAIELSDDMLEQDPESLEGVFFDMHARAFKAMFWADNGKPSKVLSDIDNMYRSTLKGIEFKEAFADFYFSSGLYNYYIVAYIEKHPVYKPIALMFRKGNKELGLKELQIAVNKATYIKYEAMLFMSLLQLNYEENIPAAIDHAAGLYNLFPENIYYMGQYLIILCHNRNYTVASVLNEKLSSQKEPFHQMIYWMTEAFLDENHHKAPARAKSGYMNVIRIAEKFGPVADLYAAIAYAGLARIAEMEGDSNNARKLRRKASRLSVYDFILDF